MKEKAKEYISKEDQQRIYDTKENAKQSYNNAKDTVKREMPEGAKEKYYEGKGYAGKAYNDAKGKAKEYVPEDREKTYKGDRDFKNDGRDQRDYNKDKSSKGDKWYTGGAGDKMHKDDKKILNESDQHRSKGSAKYGFVDQTLKGS